MISIWPFRITSGSSEVVEYKTDVLRTFSAEQRIKLRKSPRTIYEYSHQLTAEEFGQAKQVMWGNGLVGQFYVPVWSDGFNYVGTIPAGAASISMDTTEVDWLTPNLFPGAAGGALTVDKTSLTVDSTTITVDLIGDPIGYLLLWESSVKYELLRYSNIAPSSFTLIDLPTEDYDDPTILPIRLCYPMGSVTVERRSLDDTQVTAQFVTVESPEHSTSSGTTLSGKPVWTAPYRNLGTVSESISRPAVYNDNGFGIIQIDPLFNKPDFGQTISLFYQGKSDKRSKVGFVKSLFGKQKSFWLPSFNNDIPVVTGSSTTQIVTNKYMNNSDYVGRGVYVRYTNGTVATRTITAATDVAGGRVALSLSSALPTSLSSVNADLVSLMSLVRSDTDAFRFSIGTDYSGTVTFNVLETST